MSTAPQHPSCNEVDNVSQYYDDLKVGNAYFKDISELATKAEKYLMQRVTEYNLTAFTTKLAIVLDVDDTSLSNFIGIKKDNFSNSLELMDARFHTTNLLPVTPILELYKKALANNVAVFFVSARKSIKNLAEDLQPYVITNLQQAGYADWTGLFMSQTKDHDLSHQEFKTGVRKNLEESGYHIVLNIGDQDCDLDGGYAECAVKLPNLLYGTKSSALFFASPQIKDDITYATKNINCR